MANNESEYIWTNWGNTVHCNPKLISYPGTKEEIISIIKEALSKNKKIRVTSTAYSWSPLIPTDDYLINMTNFNKIEMAGDNHIIVEAGATVDQVAEFCIKNNVCIPSNVVTGMGDAQYGGVIAPGNQGSGKDCCSVSDYIDEITVVTGTCEFKSFSVDNDGENIMNAVRLSLGLFGIIYSLKLKIEPMFNVHIIETMETIDYVKENIKNLVNNNDYLQMWYNPYHNKVRVHRANKTNKPINRTSFSAQNTNHYKQTLLEKADEIALKIIDSPVPVYLGEKIYENPSELVPQIVKTSYEAANLYDYVTNIIYYTYNTDYSYILVSEKIVDIEVLYELDDDMKSVNKAIDILEKKTKEWADKGEYPLNVDSCLRFIKNSNCLLHPAYNNTRTGMIEVYANYKTKSFPKYSGEVAKAWLDELPNAKLHWAKAFQFVENAPKVMKSLYKEQINLFLKIKEETGVDPNNIFVNDYLSEIFS